LIARIAIRKVHDPPLVTPDILVVLTELLLLPRGGGEESTTNVTKIIVEFGGFESCSEFEGAVLIGEYAYLRGNQWLL